MKDRLAIFDLDGTLVDTLRANYEAYKYSANKCKKKWLISYEDYRNKYFGKSYKYFVPRIADADINECELIHNIKESVYEDFLRKYGRVNENVTIIAKLLKKRYYLALITTASRKNANTVKEMFLSDIGFDLMITGEDVKKIKPNPEAFEQAMNELEISPEKTIVFDDIGEYTEVAEKLGMTAFHIIYHE